jgi:hypothetical protein
MVSVLVSGKRGSSPDLVKPKTIKLVCVASSLSTYLIKEKEQRLVGSESG